MGEAKRRYKETPSGYQINIIPAWEVNSWSSDVDTQEARLLTEFCHRVTAGKSENCCGLCSSSPILGHTAAFAIGMPQGDPRLTKVFTFAICEECVGKKSPLQIRQEVLAFANWLIEYQGANKPGPTAAEIEHAMRVLTEPMKSIVKIRRLDDRRVEVSIPNETRQQRRRRAFSGR
jgi:hypothetical protein